VDERLNFWASWYEAYQVEFREILDWQGRRMSLQFFAPKTECGLFIVWLTIVVILQLVKQRWASTAKPESLEGPILEALKAGGAKSEL